MGKKKGKSDINELKNEVKMDEHQVSINELMQRYGSNVKTVSF